MGKTTGRCCLVHFNVNGSVISEGEECADVAGISKVVYLPFVMIGTTIASTHNVAVILLVFECNVPSVRCISLSARPVVLAFLKDGLGGRVASIDKLLIHCVEVVIDISKSYRENVRAIPCPSAHAMQEQVPLAHAGQEPVARACRRRYVIVVNCCSCFIG